MTENTENQDALALMCNVWGYDDGVGLTILRDKIVTFRKGHTCEHCCGEIKQGERGRAMQCVIYGKMEARRWCPACTAAMRNADDTFDERWRER